MRRLRYKSRRQQRENSVDVSWGDWGFAAAVTGVLLTGGGVIVRWLLSFVDSLSKSHTSERSEWADAHRSERIEWREEIRRVAESRDERLDRFCDELTIAVRDLGNIIEHVDKTK